MNIISPKYAMTLIESIENAIWSTYKSYQNVLFYIKRWHEEMPGWNFHDENFAIIFNDSGKEIDLSSTLHGMPEDLLLKIAIDLGIETPDFIPSIPTFRNEIKANYPTASITFEKAFRSIDSDPSTAIGLANSALESIIKEILNDSRIKIQYNPKDTLYQLTRDILREFSLFPNKTLPEEIRNIGSSLLKISQSIERLRSNQTEFHGKTSDDYIVDDPIYAYFCVNAICTVGNFLLSFYKNRLPCLEEGIDYTDLPF